MKLKYLLQGFICTGIIFLTSCKTQKDLNYFQDVDKITSEEVFRLEKATLQTGDQLVITVMARDNEVAKPFNQSYSAGQLIQNTQIPGNTPSNFTTASGPTYIVDDNGDIDFPILGKINTRNKTVNDFKEDLSLKLERYIKNPTVLVQHTNFRISVMGEVNRPGEYTLPDGKGTVLGALSMAGDLTIYGKREDVLLIRNVDGNLTKSRLDLTNTDFINSPYYSLRQGDVIYVSSNVTKQKSSRLDPNAGIYISVASIVVTILALVFKK